jgi:hypothetical protein
MKIHPVGAELFHADGRTDRHNVANRRFRNFGKAPKNVQHEKFRLIIRIITALPTFSQTILMDIQKRGPQIALS